MTNVLDGKELANGSYAYTTKLQDREQKKKSGILRVVNKLGKLGFTFNKIRKDYIQMLVGRKRPSWAPVKRKLVRILIAQGSFLHTETEERRIDVPLVIKAKKRYG